jgi:large subunit ribosomal protein L9
MEVILLDHIEKVGAKHEVVKVRDGFGRNYLIPQGLALVANRANMSRLEGLKKVAGRKEAAVIAAFQETAKQLSGQTLTIVAKAGESGRLFGSVTAQHIAQAIQAVGIDVEKRMIEMPEEVKDLGQYKASVKFHPEVEAVVNFEVVSDRNQNQDVD